MEPIKCWHERCRTERSSLSNYALKKERMTENILLPPPDKEISGLWRKESKGSFMEQLLILGEYGELFCPTRITQPF